MEEDNHKQATEKLEKVKKSKNVLDEIEKKLQEEILDEIKKKKTVLNEIEQKLENEIKEIENYVKEPKHIKFFKFLAILTVLGIIAYILSLNFLISKDFNYFYDIGGEEDTLNHYLSPDHRVSDIINNDNLNYREAKEALVYFTIPIARNSKKIYIQTRFKDNFPNNSIMAIGAKDQEDWHYNNNEIFKKESNESEGWIIKETMFDIERDVLYIKDGKLSFLFNIPHLNINNNETNQMYIPIDWINITVHKPGLLEEYNIDQEKLRFWKYINIEKIKFWKKL